MGGNWRKKGELETGRERNLAPCIFYKFEPMRHALDAVCSQEQD